MQKLINSALVVLFLSATTACSPVKISPVATYTIGNTQNIAENANIKTNSTLLITAPIANPGYESDEMIYVLTPFQLQHFSAHRWVAPPAQMLLPLFRQALYNTHYFHAVATTPFSGNADYRLDTQLLALQQEFLLPTSRVHLIVQAVLLNNVDNKVIATHVFEILLPTQQNAPYSGVLTTIKAANSLSETMAAFVCRNLQ